MDELRAQARENVKDGLHRLRRWWSRKYKLPTTHESFQKLTTSDLILEYYEDLWLQKEALEDTRRARQLTPEENARLTDVQAALKETPYSGDPLIEKWERDIREGRIPNLDEVTT